VLVVSDDVPLVHPTRNSIRWSTGISALRSFQLYLESRKTMLRGLIECDPGVRVPNRASSAKFDALSYAFAAATFN
jgi:hypothetical protein